MNNPSVDVKEITLEDAARVGSAPRVDLGDASTSANLNQFLSAIRAKPGTKAFVLNWRGGKIPSGAQVGAHVITWTQHGIVRSGGRMIGTYERLIERGGADGNEQRMLVFIWP